MAESEVVVASKNLRGAQAGNKQFSISMRALVKRWGSTTPFLFLFILLVGASICWVDFASFSSPIYVIIGGPKSEKTQSGAKTSKNRTIEFALNCSNDAMVKKMCANTQSALTPEAANLSATSTAYCPDYFRWIHEDLRPWKTTGISRDMIERVKEHSHFRLVILNGKAYLDKFHGSYQTRDLFTVWGFVQLLRFYPGRVPDLELMFRCNDRPLVQKRDYQGPNAMSPPALFSYCGHDNSLAIIFPDWSFWGWVEVNIKPWSSIVERIIEGNKRTKWKRRKPYAYWKGNPSVSANRGDLMTCNVSKKGDWGVRLYIQDWLKEIDQGFKQSNLEDQCTHRYKIYIEGEAWSVSEKYILACDSMTLLVRPEFYDFFSRGMEPMQHYWPIRSTDTCRDLNFAVQWGNKHTSEAQEIGKAASKYVQEEVKMENVYSYMLHLLSEYAKLLKFKPEIPTGAVELCAEAMACSEKGLRRKFMVESMVRSPSETLPCTMPPPYDPPALQTLLSKRENMTRRVETWSDKYWEKKHWEEPTPATSI